MNPNPTDVEQIASALRDLAAVPIKQILADNDIAAASFTWRIEDLEVRATYALADPEHVEITTTGGPGKPMTARLNWTALGVRPAETPHPTIALRVLADLVGIPQPAADPSADRTQGNTP